MILQKLTHSATIQAKIAFFIQKGNIRFDRMHRIRRVLICTQPGKIKICFEIKKWVMQYKKIYSAQYRDKLPA